MPPRASQARSGKVVDAPSAAPEPLPRVSRQN
jgi:hypothetical protein